ncbi:MAG: hypothetical protein ABIO72_04325 [Patescibacteria group bacterium]
MRPKRDRHARGRAHQAFTAFIAVGGLAIAVATAFFSTPSSPWAYAASSDNILGWAWADPIGWISLNDTNPGSGGGTYGVNVDPSTGAMNGFAWSENAGWVCFGTSCTHPDCIGTVPASVPTYNSLRAELNPAPYSSGGAVRDFHGWAKVCNEGNEGWISLNCADVSPSACGSYSYHVPFDMSSHFFEDTTGGGSPANGTSFAWNGNDDGTGFGFIDFHQAHMSVSTENTDPSCSDGLDNDIDGAIDCTDSGCATATPCVTPPSLTEDMCPLGTADLCCSDSTDNEGDGPVDCEDTDCQSTASMCTISWLKTQFGNVYAQQGIDAIAAPASQYNASYCLSVSNGSISGFASQSGCEHTTPQLSLPSGSTGYKGSLGSIDVAGIERGRFGAVQLIADGNALPPSLGGKVYLYSGGGSLMLPARMFTNGVGSSGRGNGLLYVKGADLHITGDLSYASASVQNYLRNLASFGVIVTRDAGTGVGGHIIIDPTVRTLAGAFFAETSISTGVTKSPLTIYGLIASRELVLERLAGSSSTAAETIIFDGRAVANPPPGMQDIGKSLPTTKDAF